jgi:2-succinyl-6-hydroxy-2,4-cyclohexadiene-1-carboxylate synthase
VRSRGAGTPVLALHGFTGSGESMEGVERALADTHAVHRVDLVGHGESAAPKDVAPYAMDRCVDQLAALLGTLEIERAHLVGYSMGGRTALTMAARRPERVASLCLVGATPGLAHEEERAERRRADEALAERILCDGLEAFVDDWMALPLFASQKRLGEAALARARAERLRQRPRGLAGSLRGMGTGAMTPLHDALAGIEQPVLLVVGDEDEKFAAIAERMARALPNAGIARLVEAGHAAHLEQPEAFARVLRSFLARAEGPGDAARVPSGAPS